MNFSKQTTSWIILLLMVLSFGGGVTITTYAGGCKLWVAILTGLSVAATNILHALKSSPNDTSETTVTPNKV
jgi:hypothetical protein